MRFLPVTFHNIYIVFTLLFSFYGPKVYLGYDKLSVSLFIAVYLIVVNFGFRIGYLQNAKTSKNESIFNKEKVLKYLKLTIRVALILYVINFIYQVATGRLSLNLLEIGANYANYYEYYYDKKESSIFTFEVLFLVISAVPKYVSLALGFYYFKELPIKYKRYFIFFVVLIILTQTLTNGNQKSIGDIVIFAAIALLLRSMEVTRVRRRKILRRTFQILIGLFVLLSFSQYSRLADRGLSISDINNEIASYSYFDGDHLLFDILGDKAGFGVTVFISGYLSGGYYGLSKTLGLPFKWTYGVGNSVAATTLSEKITGIDIYSDTYLNRMEKEFGIPGKRQWHTIFPWLASDFTFIGTLLLFFPISYYYGKSWKEVLIYRNVVSILLFSLLSVMFVFVPANNQIFHGYDYLVISLFVIFLWRRNHINFNSNII